MTRVGPDPHTGRKALYFGIVPEQEAAHSDWTETLVHEPMLMIADGVVASAPIVQSRLPGRTLVGGEPLTEARPGLVEGTLEATADEPCRYRIRNPTVRKLPE